MNYTKIFHPKIIPSKIKQIIEKNYGFLLGTPWYGLYHHFSYFLIVDIDDECIKIHAKRIIAMRFF